VVKKQVEELAVGLAIVVQAWRRDRATDEEHRVTHVSVSLRSVMSQAWGRRWQSQVRMTLSYDALGGGDLHPHCQGLRHLQEAHPRAHRSVLPILPRTTVDGRRGRRGREG
jgi:hypothetical protein